ncbi:hypothetical protein CHS0354_007833 [Potamilus streckersoni]|uniref:K Homology domain-containing protein n=1 Tax=Potamilus streckersoni TaxID=2493646 RepID=A0AAE0SKG7_9BIVA|nr:hypothetical protein CHS0354_007833 [Potamilus streckersoni]
MTWQSLYIQSIIGVPRTSVGIIIGKGGGMIKKIQAETGVKVQFHEDDGQSPERACSIKGNKDRLQQATSMINELLQQVRFYGEGTDFSLMDQWEEWEEKTDGNYQIQTTSVPADKSGHVIGKVLINEKAGVSMGSANQDFKNQYVQGFGDGQNSTLVWGDGFRQCHLNSLDLVNSEGSFSMPMETA